MSSVYENLGMKRVINGAGKMTALGVSTILDETGKTMVEAAQNFVEIEKLYEVAGKKLATLVGSTDACIVNSASAGISLSVASLITKDNLNLIESFTSKVNSISKREIIILKGHNVNYGAPIQTMIELGGGKVVEVGSANISKKEHVDYAINENTLAIMYVKSHHCVQKNMVTLNEILSVAKKHDIPVLVDAAAESDLSKYIDLGVDMAIYSGAKAISGPTSGFVACSNVEYANNLRLQFKGIGRAMKVGKESIVGLVKAVELYLDNKVVTLVTEDKLEEAASRLNKIVGLNVTVSKDAGRPIYRLHIVIDEKSFGCNGLELVEYLKNYNPAIYTRDHSANLNILEVDPRGLNRLDELEDVLTAIESKGEKQ